MVNIDEFVKRLEIILDYYSLNASSFADKIGVQRSSMSHLLSGRNKPSLDFVMKIMEVFPDVDLYWILNGTGEFPKIENEAVTNSFPEYVKTSTPASIHENENTKDLFSQIEEVEKKEVISYSKNESSNFSVQNGEIEKIVFFYKNGTFKVYIP